MDEDFSQLANLLNSPSFENQLMALMIMQGQGFITEKMQEYFSNIKKDRHYVMPNHFLKFVRNKGQWDLSLSLLDYLADKDIPNEVGKMKHLKILELRGDFIGWEFREEDSYKYVEQICGLTELETLQLKGFSFSSLPPAFESLKKLKKIRFENNQLKTFPKEILAIEDLEILYLNGNELVEIPKEIAKLKKLKFLNLADNNLTRIPPQIIAMPSLYQLDIRKNNFHLWRKNQYRAKSGSVLSIMK